MRPLRYPINVTLDGCCDHRAGIADAALHTHAVGDLERAHALLFGRGKVTGGVRLPLALAEPGLSDEHEFVVQPILAGHGPTLPAGLSQRVDLRLVDRLESASGAVATRCEPRR